MTPNASRVIDVIEVELPGLTQYWSTDGVLLAERDTEPSPELAPVAACEDEAAAVRRSTKDHYEAQVRAVTAKHEHQMSVMRDAVYRDRIQQAAMAQRDVVWHEQLELAARALYDADPTKAINVDPPPRDPSDYLRLREWLSKLQTAIFFTNREGPAP